MGEIVLKPRVDCTESHEVALKLQDGKHCLGGKDGYPESK